MANYEVLLGDVREQLKTLEDDSIDSVITSPPYFGLRDYGNDKQIGLEKTLKEYLDEMVDVFREVKRVLKPEGTFWLNIGDSYNGSGGSGGDYNKGGWKEGQPKYGRKNDTSLKPKDLMLVPHRLAIALQEDGWWVRQDIVWNKPNPMPEPATDRCVKAHEYVFLLTKSKKYHFDHEAIKEAAIWNGNRKLNPKDYKGTKNPRYNGNLMRSGRSMYGETRNKRSVWTVPTKPFKGAHFAVFPPELIRPMVLAGCPIGGTILDPFGGSGTTAGVAVSENRNAILIELNSEYAALIPERVEEILGYKLEEGESATINENFGEWFS